MRTATTAKFRNILGALALACAVLLQAPTGMAATILERSFENSIGGRFSNQNAVQTYQHVANSFVLASDATLTDVHWWGGFQDDAADTTADFRIRLYADSSSPGATLYEQVVDPVLTDTGLTTPVLGGDVTLWAFTADPVATFSFTAGVTYWLEIAYLPPLITDEFVWSRAVTSDGLVATGPGGIGSWGVVSGASDSAFALTGRLASIPEPASALLFAAGLASFGFARRRARG